MSFQTDADDPAADIDVHHRRRVSTETKSSFKTSEFFAYLAAAVAGVLVASHGRLAVLRCCAHRGRRVDRIERDDPSWGDRTARIDCGGRSPCHRDRAVDDRRWRRARTRPAIDY